ncbi:hypothetical protein CHH28_13680 [Bacterioplanes sanyensis]|uniref:Glycosyltransferase n=1 Tax=Bacterioplanes sanyensis TaxID=1249553 RepID=A0A222FKU1_9GAMM|nr:glycosyltransferase family 4 protein [Bacterioplanes sanyensis]ASP39657.1 hypothetical protein CHH28_13680 [Bacterioplanes sanyensis]
MNQSASVSQPATLLFVHFGDDWIRGSERCLLDLMQHLDPQRYRAVLWCNSPVMAAAARELGIIVIQQPFTLLLGWSAPRFNVLAYGRLVRDAIALIKRFDVALVHVNSGAPTQWMHLAARWAGLPLVTHLHCRYPLKDRLSLGLHQASMLVGVSAPVIEQLVDDGMPAERCSVIANGIDTRALETQSGSNLRTLLQLDDSDFLLVTVGSLIHRKGMDLIIQAVSELGQLGIDAHLAIIGDGEERAALQQQTLNLGLQQRIHILGERSNVSALLRQGADVFVSAAREEVFGLVLAEAGLNRLPVVAPKVGGIPTVVRAGETGLLVEHESVPALTQALASLHNDPALRRQLGEAGRQRVLKHFSIEQYVGRFEALYQRLLQKTHYRMGWLSPWRLPLMSTVRSIKRVARHWLPGADKPRHTLVLDPTAFAGGSKVATDTALGLLDRQRTRVTVLTSSPQAWHSEHAQVIRLKQPSWLASRDHGTGFFARHLYLAGLVLFTRLRCGRIDTAIGASGPGVDLALYLLKPLLGFRLLQLVHGPVATSRTLGRCLLQANSVHYLTSATQSMLSAIRRYQPSFGDSLPNHCQPLKNGIAQSAWPQPCQYQQPVVFWAASLLKWKGLNTLVAALRQCDSQQRPPAHICFIRPQQTSLPISQAPVQLGNVQWHEDPDELDAIRAQCNIFVSTSDKEPFGLSILEALAAGHCVVIPDDGAYWSQHLVDGEHCLLYPPGDSAALAELLQRLSLDMETVRRIGSAAQSLAQHYRAEQRLEPLRRDIEQSSGATGRKLSSEAL